MNEPFSTLIEKWKFRARKKFEAAAQETGLSRVSLEGKAVCELNCALELEALLAEKVDLVEICPQCNSKAVRLVIPPIPA